MVGGENSDGVLELMVYLRWFTSQRFWFIILEECIKRMSNSKINYMGMFGSWINYFKSDLRQTDYEVGKCHIDGRWEF